MIKNERKQDINKSSSKIIYNNEIRAIGIGISTGGPPIIAKILSSLPKTFKIPILIVQHMPANFTFEFASRLNETSKLLVKQAVDGEKLKPGFVYLAPGGKQMKVENCKGRYTINIYDGEKVNGHKPSADILFSSMAQCFGKNSLGIIMTGMGSDGSNGLQELKNKGAVTWGQNEETSVVYGMPKIAFEKGAVCEQLSVYEIIERLNSI